MSEHQPDSDSLHKDFKAFALDSYRTILGLLMAVGVWLAAQIYVITTDIQKDLVKKVQVLEVRVEKFVPNEAINAAHDTIKREIAAHDTRLKGVETSQEYQLRNQASMSESLNRLEKALGTK